MWNFLGGGDKVDNEGMIPPCEPFQKKKNLGVSVRERDKS